MAAGEVSHDQPARAPLGDGAPPPADPVDGAPPPSLDLHARALAEIDRREAATRFCSACGAPRAQDAARFCTRCGNALLVAEASGGQRSLGDDPGMRLLLPVGRSALAIVAGYLGLLSLALAPAPFALIVGVLAIRDLRRHPGRHGLGRAVFAVVMGGLFTVLLALLLIAGP